MPQISIFLLLWVIGLLLIFLVSSWYVLIVIYAINFYLSLFIRNWPFVNFFILYYNNLEVIYTNIQLHIYDYFHKYYAIYANHTCIIQSQIFF